MGLDHLVMTMLNGELIIAQKSPGSYWVSALDGDIRVC